MAKKRPTTIAAYIDAAPPDGKPHLAELYALLKSVAPKAEETIKWGTPFFIEPRFLFAFSAHKAHVGFMTSNDALKEFRDALKGFEITRMGILKLPYNKPIPKALIKKLARARLKIVKGRNDDSFW